ncbi:O-antigen ligase family protein [Proteiniclasticum sp. C24MP]|uniref:O-antigen ligase family protein n=1 Tax=Proteiniclasticum sp. C24MP TaxID=3374101 RepID=UPI0037546F4C
MKRDIEATKVNNFLLYLLIGVVPLIVIPIDGTLETARTKLLALLCISLVFLCLSIGRRDQITFLEDTLENRFLAGYFILVLLSLFFSLNPQISILGSRYRHDGFLAFITYCFAYLIARNAKNIEKLFFPIVSVTSVLIALYAVLQFYELDPVPLELYALEWVGVSFATMGNPNFLGSYLVLSIPIPIYLYFYKGKKSGLLAYAILFLALLTTRTRGSWIGAFLALVSFLALHHYRSGFTRTQWKKVLMVFLTSIGILVLFVFTSGNIFASRFLSIFTDFFSIIREEETAYLGGSSRVYIWGKVMELIRMRPFFGFGLDTMYLAMEMYFRGQITSDFGKYKNWDKAHNEYLNVAVSSGVFSLLAYLGFLFFALKKGMRNLKKHEAYVPLLAAIIGYLTQAFFNIQVVMVYYIFFVYLGIVTSETAIMEEKKPVSLPEKHLI